MDIIEKRKKVYKDFPKKNLNISLEDLVLLYDIEDKDYLKLINSTKLFLLKSINLAYNTKYTLEDFDEDFLTKNREKITSLPNKTPNGIINPKIETKEEYNNLQIALNNVFKNTGVFKYIKSYSPLNIRFKDSIEDPKSKTRPYYTSKFHSDAWVGHRGDSIFLIGLLGDISNNTVEFREPIGVQNNYLDKADSFDEGNKRYKESKYLGKLKTNTLGVMDHACLHRTCIEEGSKPRLSLDVAVIVDSKYSHSYDEGFDITAYKYYSKDILGNIGKSFEYHIPESINNSTTTTIEVDKKIN
jgi:hypothetical protein